MFNVSANCQHKSSRTVEVCNTKLLVLCTQMVTDTHQHTWMDRQADPSIPPRKHSFCRGMINDRPFSSLTFDRIRQFKSLLHNPDS